jgi:hypothetical protein
MLQLKLLKGGLDNDTLGSLSPQQFEAFLPTSAAALRLLHLQRPALSDAAYLSPDLHHRRGGGSGETNITSVLTEVLNPPKEPHFHCRGNALSNRPVVELCISQPSYHLLRTLEHTYTS